MVTSHEPYTKYWMNMSADRRVLIAPPADVLAIALT
jgi:hypothetical protein